MDYFISFIITWPQESYKYCFITWKGWRILQQPHTQLKRSSEGLSVFTIPTFIDQLTNSRIRSCRIQRDCDLRKPMESARSLLMRLWSFPSMHEPYLGNTSCALRLFGAIWQFNLFYLPSDKTRPWQRECGFDSPKKFAENISSDSSDSDSSQDLLWSLINSLFDCEYNPVAE